MCQWGRTRTLRLLIPADLSSTGQPRWKDVAVDACIADLVAALQRAGIHMRASCCGHGEREGQIDLQDGRTLIIRSSDSHRCLQREMEQIVDVLLHLGGKHFPILEYDSAAEAINALVKMKIKEARDGL